MSQVNVERPQNPQESFAEFYGDRCKRVEGPPDRLVRLRHQLEPVDERRRLVLADFVDRAPEVLRRRRRRVVRAGQVKHGVLPHLGIVVLKKRDNLFGSEHGDNLRGPAGAGVLSG